MQNRELYQGPAKIVDPYDATESDDQKEKY